MACTGGMIAHHSSDSSGDDVHHLPSADLGSCAQPPLQQPQEVVCSQEEARLNDILHVFSKTPHGMPLAASGPNQLARMQAFVKETAEAGAWRVHTRGSNQMLYDHRSRLGEALLRGHGAMEKLEAHPLPQALAQAAGQFEEFLGRIAQHPALLAAYRKALGGILDARFVVLEGFFLTVGQLARGMLAAEPAAREHAGAYVVLNHAEGGRSSSRMGGVDSTEQLLLDRATDIQVDVFKQILGTEEPWVSTPIPASLESILQSVLHIEYGAFSRLVDEVSRATTANSDTYAAPRPLACAALASALRSCLAERKLGKGAKIATALYSSNTDKLDRTAAARGVLRQVLGDGATMCPGVAAQALVTDEPTAWPELTGYVGPLRCEEIKRMPARALGPMLLLPLGREGGPLARDGSWMSVCSGINSENLVVSGPLTCTPQHVEDVLMGSANILMAGQAKLWEVLSDGQTFSNQLLARRASPAHANTVLIKQEFGTFTDAGFASISIVQQPGTTMITLPGHTWHHTTSAGTSLAIALNWGTPPESVKDFYQAARSKRIGTRWVEACRNIDKVHEFGFFTPVPVPSTMSATGGRPSRKRASRGRNSKPTANMQASMPAAPTAMSVDEVAPMEEGGDSDHTRATQAMAIAEAAGLPALGITDHGQACVDHETAAVDHSPTVQATQQQLPAVSYQLTQHQLPAVSCQATQQQLPAVSYQPTQQQLPAVSYQPTQHQLPAVSYQPTQQQLPAVSCHATQQQLPAVSCQPTQQQLPADSCQATQQQLPAVSNQPTQQQLPEASYQPTQQPQQQQLPAASYHAAQSPSTQQQTQQHHPVVPYKLTEQQMQRMHELLGVPYQTTQLPTTQQAQQVTYQARRAKHLTIPVQLATVKRQHSVTSPVTSPAGRRLRASQQDTSVTAAPTSILQPLTQAAKRKKMPIATQSAAFPVAMTADAPESPPLYQGDRQEGNQPIAQPESAVTAAMQVDAQPAALPQRPLTPPESPALYPGDMQEGNQSDLNSDNALNPRPHEPRSARDTSCQPGAARQPAAVTQPAARPQRPLTPPDSPLLYRDDMEEGEIPPVPCLPETTEDNVLVSPPHEARFARVISFQPADATQPASTRSGGHWRAHSWKLGRRLLSDIERSS